jgi:hypothetical protein
MSQESCSWSKTRGAHEYFVLGEQRADADHKDKLLYVYNDFAMPMIASTQTRRQKDLVLNYYRVSASLSTRTLQRAYLAAFVSGYRKEMLKIKGNAVISPSPLIFTFAEYIMRYARDHNGIVPTFGEVSELVSRLKYDYIGFDPYAGTGLKYGANVNISGKALGSLNGKTALIWVIPKDRQRQNRTVAFADGTLHDVSANEWKSLAAKQHL